MATYEKTYLEDKDGRKFINSVEIGDSLLSCIPRFSWHVPDDRITKGPSRELVRDSFGVLLDGGVEGQRASFTFDPATLKLITAVLFDGMIELGEFSLNGVINGGKWIRDSKGNFLPRQSCFIELCRCDCNYRTARGTPKPQIIGGDTTGTHFQSAWIIYDCRDKRGRLIALH